MNYGISSRDYLERAKQCLAQGGNDYLFYAAFEIRCGVEARLQEYLEVQTHISKKKREGWQVAKLENNIEHAFQCGDKGVVLKIYDNVEIKFEARYTPVKKPLRLRAKRLGNYLHNAKEYYDSEDVFWSWFRDYLLEAIEELEHANSGRLLGPLLLHPNKTNVYMNLELPTSEEQELAKQLFSAGDHIVMKVEYE